MAPPTSCLLFHGPGSETRSHEEAAKFGKKVPFEGSGLKKDGARSFVELLSSLPVGSGTRSVVVGPMDEVAPGTSDVLLKTLEEFDPTGIRPFLWAWDLGGVSPTIRSRCVCFYVPGVDDRLEGYRTQAQGVLAAYRARDWVTLIESWGDLKGEEVHLLRATVDVLSSSLGGGTSFDPRLGSLWESLRPLLGPAPLTPARVVSAFLEAGL
jgi:hypothetical protein